jgi:16S rRNA G966 N2-methylase RsmD
VVPGPVLQTIARYPAEIVFIDPPYELERDYAAVLERLAKAPPELTIVQHSVRLALPEEVEALRRGRVVRQGDNALSFYS